MKVLPSLAFGCAEDVLLVAHLGETTPDDEWNEFIDFANAQEGLAGMIVLAGGAKVNPHQRNSIRDLYSKYSLRIAVLTPSKIVVGMATALKWFGVQIQPVGPEDIDAAARYVGRSDIIDIIKGKLEPFMDKKASTPGSEM